jgi:MFS family permease
MASPADPLHHPGAGAPPSTFEEATYRKVTWRLAPFLMLCYVVAYLDRVNVGFAKLQMTTDLGLSDAVYGFGAGIFFLGYFIFEVPSNVILHKVGARVWIARIMVSWGVISMLTMFVTTPTMFYVMRFLLGLAEAGFFPGIILYLTYWYPAHRRGRMTTLFMTAIALSGVIGGPVSGYILKSFNGMNGWHGWQWLFLLEGVPSVIVGIMVFLMLDDRISKAKWLTNEEKELLERQVSAEEATKHDMPISQVLRSGRVLMFSLTYFSFVMGLYGVSFWLPTIIKATGVTDSFMIGLLSAIPFAAAVVAMVLVSRSADRRRERRWHIALPAFAGAHARDHGHFDHAAAVLEFADSDPRRHGCRSRYRDDQFDRQSRGLSQPVRGRLAEAGHGRERFRHVYAGGVYDPRRFAGGQCAGEDGQ